MPSQNPKQNASVWGKLLELAQTAPSQPSVPPGTFQVPPPVIDPFAAPPSQAPVAPAAPAPRGPRLDPDKVRRFQDSFKKSL